MHKLKPITSLGSDNPYQWTNGDFKVNEQTHFAIVSIAIFKSDGGAAKKDIKSKLKHNLPDVMRVDDAAKSHLLWIAADQYWLLASEEDENSFAESIAKTLEDKAAVTLQSDAWAIFDVNTPDIVSFGERMCAVDFANFPVGSVTRTVIEHVGAIVWRVEENSLRLICPRSMAGSFTHHIEVILKSLAS